MKPTSEQIDQYRQYLSSKEIVDKTIKFLEEFKKENKFEGDLEFLSNQDITAITKIETATCPECDDEGGYDDYLDSFIIYYGENYIDVREDLEDLYDEMTDYAEFFAKNPVIDVANLKEPFGLIVVEKK